MWVSLLRKEEDSRFRGNDGVAWVVALGGGRKGRRAWIPGFAGHDGIFWRRCLILPAWVWRVKMVGYAPLCGANPPYGFRGLGCRFVVAGVFLAEG
jgi:hypothetical protein